MAVLEPKGPLERMLARDRAIVIAALGAVIFVSWIYVLLGAGAGMSAFDMSSLRMALGLPAVMGVETGFNGGVIEEKGIFMARPMQVISTPASWTTDYVVLMFFMWWIMMIAMMLPSATPMILLHAAIARKGRRSNVDASVVPQTFAFVFGYLLSWAAFSVVAVILQRGFEAIGVLSPMMLNAKSAIFAGAILIAAGLYQLTPLKQACLRHCRGPIGFLSHHWRDGPSGAFKMGLHHGIYCLGCCWGLMALLFFGGIMNLYWIIGLAVIVLLEKLLPIGQRLSLVTGGLFSLWGVYFIYAGLTASGM